MAGDFRFFLEGVGQPSGGVNTGTGTGTTRPNTGSGGTGQIGKES